MSFDFLVITALAQTLAASVPITFAAGVASFLSPCVLPLIPGYISYVAGISAEAGRDEKASRSVLLSVAIFVAGFTTIFVGLGMSATLLGHFLASRQVLLTRIAGVLVILMGLAFIGVLPLPWLYAEKRFRVAGAPGAIRSYLIGMAFGFGWSPCIGLTLGAALGIASTETRPGRGALLLLAYSLGLGIPFLLAAAGVSKLSQVLAWVRKHQVLVLRTGGIMLILFGLLMVFNKVFLVASTIQRAMEAAGLEELVGL